jgi:hypothetical protein
MAGPLRASGVSLVAICLVALAGCGGSQDAPVESVAERFYAAVQAQDGASACALLAPETRSEVEQTSGSPCAQGLFEAGIPSARSPLAISVFGTMGQVRYDGETAYLTRFGTTWLVMAAGCTKQALGPDDCLVKGG